MSAKRLTPRQAAVLAAVERTRRVTLLDLRNDFPDLAPSAVRRVLSALERRGLVESVGDESRVYLGGVVYSPASDSSAPASEPLDEDRLDPEFLPEPARSALRQQVGIVTGCSLIAVTVEVLAERLAVGADDIKAAEEVAARGNAEDEQSTAALLGQILAVSQDISGRSGWFASALGVPADYEGFV